MGQEQRLQLEIKFLLGYYLKSLMRRKSTEGRLFPGGGMSKFQAGVGTHRSRENPVIPYIKATKTNSFDNLENVKN